MNKYKTLSKLILVVAVCTTSTHAKNSKNYSSYKTQTSSYKPYYAQNGSYRGEYSKRTYRPKNEYVRPYKRNDGSQVRSHYKSRRVR